MKKTALASLVVGFMSIGTASATPFSISMVADNDFAIFSGTSTSINNILYQNDVVWNSQITSLSTLNFNLAAGDDRFYVLAMGGGGQENISGTINGVNMTDASVGASMSSDMSSFLTGYNSTDVANGVYNAILSDVQNAFNSVTWASAASAYNTSEWVIQQSGFGSGFRFDHMTAHLFSFDAVDVNVEPVSSPSVLALMGLGLAGLGYTARRKKQSA